MAAAATEVKMEEAVEHVEIGVVDDVEVEDNTIPVDKDEFKVDVNHLKLESEEVPECTIDETLQPSTSTAGVVTIKEEQLDELDCESDDSDSMDIREFKEEPPEEDFDEEMMLEDGAVDPSLTEDVDIKFEATEETLQDAKGLAEKALDAHKWTHQSTLLLLKLYNKYRGKVGSLKIRTIKRMYEEIAKEITILTKTLVTPANCENRWRVLDRNYKKYVYNVNKTGRRRKVFEYFNAMHEIVGNNNVLAKKEAVKEVPVAEKPSASYNLPRAIPIQPMVVENPEVMRIPMDTKKLRLKVLQEMRDDRKEYYKLRLDLERKKLEEKIKRNDHFEKTNELLEKILNKHT